MRCSNYLKHWYKYLSVFIYILYIDILVTSRNGDRKIMQSIRITCTPPSRKRECNQLSQFR